MGTHPIFESDFDCLTDEMRAELCNFSGIRIHPGHGIRHCKADGKVLRLLNSKVDALYHDKKNPRKLRWTILYRRKHKKGISQEATIKKRNKRNVKQPKAVAGLSYNELLAKKQQRPEVRAKQRDNAIRAAKEKKKANEANKKQARAAALKGAGSKSAKVANKGGASKPKMSKGARR